MAIDGSVKSEKLAVPIKRTFEQNCGIYGKQPREGFCINGTSPFVVFRGADKKWTVGHWSSGLVISAMIPNRLQKSKRTLLTFVQDMTDANPEACAMLCLIPDGQWPAELREYGRVLIDWARDYWPATGGD